MGKSSDKLTKEKFRNPVYLRIMLAIGEGEKTGTELGSLLKNSSRIAIIEEIYNMEKTGYIKRRKEGIKVYFRVNWFKVYCEYKKYVEREITLLKDKL